MKKFTVAAISVALVVLLIWGASDSNEELGRIPSPDGHIEILILEADGGATTSAGRKLYLVPAGREADESNVVLAIDRFEGLSVEWVANDEIRVFCTRGRIFHFKNFWSSKAVENFRRVVTLTLECKPNNIDRYTSVGE